MSIWYGNVSLDQIRKMQVDTIDELLGIEIIEIGDDFLKGKMPVDHRTHQPTGMLHGGASVVLAETLGSIAANLVVDNSKYLCLGREINANHVRPVREGNVYAVAKPINLGRKTQIWAIEITNEAGKIICTSRLTMAVIYK